MIGVKAISGVAWAYGAFVSEKALALITTIILARILTPDDFGLIAAALLIIGIIDAFRDFGIRDALIYTSDNVDLAADTTFWLSIIFGVCQLLVALALAPLAVNMIDDPRIVPVLQVLSLTFIVNSLGLTHEALLRKRLEFKGCYVADLAASGFKTATAVGLILAGAEIWSIIIAHLVGSMVRTISRWLILDWKPKARLALDQARFLLRYGTHVFLVGLLGLIDDSFDQFLIATLLDQRQLAFFFIATRLPEMLLYQLNSVLTNVIFSVFSSIKNQRELLLSAFFRTLKYSALATIPVGTGLIAVAPDLIPTIFGDQWFPSIPLMQLMSAAALPMCLSWSAGDVLKAQGRPDVILKLSVIEVVYTVPIVGLLLAYYRDPLAAAFGVMVCNTIAGAVRLGVVARVLDYPLSRYLDAFRAATVGGGLILIAVTVCRHLLGDYSSEIVLVVSVMVGFLTYLSTIWWLERDEVVEAAEYIVTAMRPARDDASLTAEGSGSPARSDVSPLAPEHQPTADGGAATPSPDEGSR